MFSSTSVVKQTTTLLRCLAGNEWHSMDSDGSLIIKKVRNTIAGIYNCMAQDFSKVLETFQVNVASKFFCTLY